MSVELPRDSKMPYWYYEKKELRHTPSVNQGISLEEETMFRREGARFILQLGNKMGLRYETMATGVVYFHRFYMVHTFQEFPRHVTACCCLFLAGKVEETPKKCKDIMRHARSNVEDATWAEFGADPREEVMTLERILLQTIKFDFIVEHPYTYLLKYAKCFKGDKKKLQSMVQMAWTFVNDGLCTTLCLQWEPEIIAIALMYLAGKLNKFEVVDWQGRNSKHTKWWDMFVQGISMELLEDICHQVLDLYSPKTDSASSGAGAPPVGPGGAMGSSGGPGGGAMLGAIQEAASAPALKGSDVTKAASSGSAPPPAKKAKKEEAKSSSPAKTEPSPVAPQPAAPYQYPYGYSGYPPSYPPPASSQANAPAAAPPTRYSYPYPRPPRSTLPPLRPSPPPTPPPLPPPSSPPTRYPTSIPTTTASVVAPPSHYAVQAPLPPPTTARRTLHPTLFPPVGLHTTLHPRPQPSTALRLPTMPTEEPPLPPITPPLPPTQGPFPPPTSNPLPALIPPFGELLPHPPSRQYYPPST